MPNDEQEVRAAVARAVAGRQVSDEAVSEVARLLAQSEVKIRRLGVCELGMCIDFLIPVEGPDWVSAVLKAGVFDGGQLKELEVFPWGIVNPDLVQVRVTHDFDAFAGGRR